MNEKTEKRGRKPAPSIASKCKKYTADGQKDYRYNYITSINNKAVIDNRWEIDILDVAIFETIKSLISHMESKTNREALSLFKPVPDKKGEGDWYPISESIIMKQCPLLPFGNWNAIHRRIGKLISCNLIERHPDNIKNRTKLIRLGKSAHLMSYATQ